ncbi:DUF1697 domain-containing protein [Flavobacterium sp. NKUCC04_CG]|uniref:DUF1697 domain-containing protein n=1 Tax=Flavobacterium sp. NKUCC04_CG TaxID=2842121 RepID=UPI001C5B3858|nr:DUF1697 domain-containing protein [Flavobacterium sp. NKUCC04_CG]MBW3519321.1 DUF1697 domain-containing protein [Flavobacterium sp. NKUCC04_CG]
MTTYISILRGINVGSHKRIKMIALRKLYDELGYKNIQIYIQSGNIVFQCQEQPQQLIEKQIEQQIQREFGFEVPVIVMDTLTLANIIENNPFSSESNPTLLHVTLLASTPEQKNLDKLNLQNYLPDQYLISNQAIYLYCLTGYGKTKLTTNFFENILQVKASTRNWKTLLHLSKMAKEIDI